jgi:isopenicillin N synthase-like dioxygenase
MEFNICHHQFSPNELNRKFNQAVDNQVFELPDKTKLEVSKEMYTIPELIFQRDVLHSIKRNLQGIPQLRRN